MSNRNFQSRSYEEPLPLDCFQAWGRELYMLGALEARGEFFRTVYRRLLMASLIGTVVLFAITYAIERRLILAVAAAAFIALILLTATRTARAAHKRTRQSIDDLRRLLRVTRMHEPWRMTPTEDEKTNQILDLCEFLIDTEDLGRFEAMRHATSLVDRGDDLETLWATANKRKQSHSNSLQVQGA